MSSLLIITSPVAMYRITLIESELLEGKAVGTPSYMPPEQFRTDDLGPESDWYAFGCMICEMLTGKILFPPSQWSKLFEKKRQMVPQDDWPKVNVSEELRQVIHGSLQPDWRDRKLECGVLRQRMDVTHSIGDGHVISEILIALAIEYVGTGSVDYTGASIDEQLAIR